MSAKTYQRILQIGIFASLGVIFLLFGNLLFPYISSKQLTFNILMELLLPFWLILIWKFPKFRPQRSLITWGLFAYFAIILISCFTGVDFNLSFWGDVERLLGFFHIFHFFLFYLYLITAFRNKEDWYWLLSASVLVAAIEALCTFGGTHIGTIGNTAYVSGYMIFNIYFALILLLHTPWRWQWPFYLAIILMLIAFLKANTSGAIIGLSASLFLLLFLMGLCASRRRWRRTALLVFGIALIGVITLFSQYKQPWFQENKHLHNLSIYKSTFQTRRLSWEGAARDFYLHPWLGTGFGNYAIIFDRQFNPEFFNYSTTETYFDRAHNNLIDITSTTGALGLLAYLSIFVFAARDWYYSLRRRGGRIKPGAEGRPVRELLVLAALIAAYFIQNLAVFDSLATYMGLMLALAYLIFLSQPAAEEDEEEIEAVNNNFPDWKEWTGFGVAGVLVLIIIFNFNVRPWRMLTGVIKGYSNIASGQISTGFLAYRQAFTLKTPLDRDGRTTLINLVIGNPTLFTRLSDDNMQDSLNYVLDLGEKNLVYNPQDSLAQMQMAQLYDVASRYYSQQPALFKSYSDKALAAAEKSLAASPRRIPVYFILAQIQANRGDMAGAEKSFLTAYDLNPNYVEVNCQLGNYYFLAKSNKYQPYVDACLDRGGKNLLGDVLTTAVKHYQETKDSARLLLAYRLLVQQNPNDALLYVNLAKAELAAGNVNEALNASIKAGDIDPSLRPAIQTFLQSIQTASSTGSTNSASSTEAEK